MKAIRDPLSLQRQVQTQSIILNRRCCSSRRILLTSFIYFIAYRNCNFAVTKTLSFDLNICPPLARYGRSTYTYGKPSERNNNSNKWLLNAIALPRISIPDSQLIDSSNANTNGYTSSYSQQQQQQQPNVGVLLLNLGGPETGDDVEGRIGVKALLSLSSRAIPLIISF